MKRMFWVTMLAATLALVAFADDFNSKVVVRYEVQPTRSLDMVSIAAPLSDSITYTWTNGDAADKAQQLVSDERTTDGTGESLDLAGGLTNGFGQTVTFTKVKLLSIEASSTNTQTVDVGGAAGTQFVNWVANSSDIVKVRPGGVLILVAPDATGYAVGAGTADLLKIKAGATASVTYKIVVIGTGTAS